jgi:hypothetical protein
VVFLNALAGSAAVAVTWLAARNSAEPVRLLGRLAMAVSVVRAVVDEIRHSMLNPNLNALFSAIALAAPGGAWDDRPAALVGCWPWSDQR